MIPFSFTIVILCLICLLVGYGLGRLLRYQEVREHRHDAIRRSQSVILGSVYEKVLPFLPDFPYAPKDMVFIGKGFDYLVLDGLSDGSLREIVFLEIKSGKSTLNKNEKSIRETVGKKHIRYEEYRI